MVKRGRLDIIKDILRIIRENRNSIRSTPLLRKSNLSSSRFKEYYSEILEKGFVNETTIDRDKFISLSDKGIRFLDKYNTIIEFIDEFEL